MAETTTIRIAIACISAAIVLGIIVFEVSIFESSKTYLKFKEDIEEIVKVMNVLSETQYGSFQRVNITIPIGYTLIFSNETNSINITNEKNQSLSLQFNIKNSLTLTSGTYGIELYYGNLDWEDIKEYTVVFN